ncbi:MAG: hypothetical protein R3D63_01715 [Paracoccaceae bacterium]
MKRFLTALGLSAALMSAAPVFAQDAKPADPVAQAEAKSTLTTDNAMINYGRAHSDALAMIAGVQMMFAVAEGTTIEAKGQPMDLGAILDEAIALAPEDELIKAKAEALRDDAEAKSRGACYWEYWCDWYGYCEYWYVCY